MHCQIAPEHCKSKKITGQFRKGCGRNTQLYLQAVLWYALPLAYQQGKRISEAHHLFFVIVHPPV